MCAGLQDGHVYTIPTLPPTPTVSFPQMCGSQEEVDLQEPQRCWQLGYSRAEMRGGKSPGEWVTGPTCALLWFLLDLQVEGGWEAWTWPQTSRTNGSIEKKNGRECVAGERDLEAEGRQVASAIPPALAWLEALGRDRVFLLTLCFLPDSAFLSPYPGKEE